MRCANVTRPWKMTGVQPLRQPAARPPADLDALDRHPWEETVCVFGELLTRVEPERTAAPGKPARRSEP
jgi:hypothetical protein